MKKSNNSGFTIIELVVVIVIIGILAAVALPRFLGLQDRAHDAVVEGAQAALASGVMMANAAWQSYGRDTALDDVVEKPFVYTTQNSASAIKCEKDGFNATPATGCDNDGTTGTADLVGLDIGTQGYPTGYTQDGTGGTTATLAATNFVRTPAHCREIWEFLMNDASMLVEEETTIDDLDNSETTFSASNSGKSCVYTYLPDLNPADASRTITYNSETGRVTVQNLTESQFSQGS